MEKMLKSFFVKRNQTIPPKIHNLMSLAERAGLIKEFSDDQLDFFANLNPYQLEGRYPGDRELLYSRTSEETVAAIIKRTEVELKWLELKLKSEN